MSYTRYINYENAYVLYVVSVVCKYSLANEQFYFFTRNYHEIFPLRTKKKI